MNNTEELLKQSLLSLDLQKEVKEGTLKQQYLSRKEVIGGSNCFSQTIFMWVSSMLKYGNKVTIDVDVMPELPEDMRSAHQFEKIQNILKTIKKSKREGMTLTNALSKSYKINLIILTVLVFLVSGLSMLGPILTNKIIQYIHLGSDRVLSQGIILFLLILLVTFSISLGKSHMYYHFAILGFNLTNTLTLLIYDKSLKYPSLCEKQFDTSQIINFSQVDAERMTYMGYQLAALVFTPVQITVGIILMYNYIGVSFLAGIGVMIITIGITFIIAKKSIKLNEEVLKVKDSRMKVTQQFLDIIRFIKINAIQKFFFQKVNKKRCQEITLYKKKGLLDVCQIFLYWLACPLILSATFLTYTFLGNQITAEVAFTVILIFTLLQYPIRSFPTAISQIIQIFTSIKRIQKYLLASQMKTDHIKQVQDKYSCDYAVKIQNGTFFWGLEKDKKEQKGKKQNKEQKKKEKKIQKIKMNQSIDEQQNMSQRSDMSMIQLIVEHDSNGNQKKQKYIKALKDVNTEILKGKFTIVIGDIGSGKSSLLNAILNEMRASENALIHVNGSIAYASQKPWILSATVRENITFTLPFNKQKFDKIAFHASLQKDFQILTKGELTEIGEKGINLSGGQKARIALARALYSEKDIYLLDDIISAVDVHVGEFLMQETILKFLKGKTILMPTHAIKFAEFADQIIIMQKGRIVQKGHYHHISKTQQFQEIFKKQIQNQEEHKKKKSEDQDAKIQEELKMLNEITKNKTKSQSKAFKNQISEKNVTENIVEELMLPEDHKKGQVDFAIFKEYLKINGGAWFVIIVVGAMTLWITFSTLSNISMEKWCEDPQGSQFYLYLFIAFAIFSNIFIFVRAYMLILSGAKQGEFVHKKIIKSLLYASLTKFYNRVPIGRIVNRLTKDLRELDEAIGFAIGNFLVNIFSLLGTLTICLYASTPYILILMVVVGFSSFKLKNYYMTTQRQVSRFEKSTNSPIVSGFLSVINGLSIIRAYNREYEFLQIQNNKIDINKKVRITRQGLESWFCQRITLLSLIVNMTAIAFCMLSSNDTASLAGLLMNYALSLSDDIINVTLSWAYFQTKIVSLERIYAFMKIEPQPAYNLYCQKWRTKQQGYKSIIERGTIQFNNVCAKYRVDLPNVLSNLKLTIKEGQKVGIVGRTGAGKSSLINTLLRITDVSSGQILIDGVNYENYPLKDLRNALTMIDQEPTLINSTFRQNLDITHQYTDDELYQILKECNLYQTIMEKEGLDGAVSNDSLSAGQKQLLCICRAFLKKSKIVLIDQATANIDLKNDQLIQKVIKNKFVDSTVLTIAHRLSTLSNSDKILVLGEGKILQWGTPQELQAREDGVYAEMVRKNLSQFLI